MAQRPPRDLNWIPDDATGINVPSQTKQNAGWLIEKPARQFFNWLANRQSRWTHYLSGQSQEFIVIDSANANEKDYDTLAAYIADAPAAGDKVLVKETQVLTAQMIIPDGITLRLLDGIDFTRSTLEANSVIKFGSDIIIEGVLNLVLSHTGTTTKAFEFDGNNVVGKINVENSSTGTLTTGYHINGNKTGNRIDGFAQNTGGGTLTNILADNSTKNTNYIIIRDLVNNNIIGSSASTTRNGLVELATNAETITGTDDTRAVTPAGLAAKLPDQVKDLDIGDWNMDTTQQKTVAHGLTLSKIRTIEGMIRTDSGLTSAPITPAFANTGVLDCNIKTIGATTVILERKSGGNFDNTNYDQTSYNRGWLKITYKL